MSKAWQEQDGSDSMRRILAAYFAILGGACFVLGTVLKSMQGVYSGISCEIAVLVLLGYTTISDIKELVSGIKATATKAMRRGAGKEGEEP